MSVGQIESVLGCTIFLSWLYGDFPFAPIPARPPHIDQIVLNLYFHHPCRILDSRYNFLVSFAHLIWQKVDTRINEIKVFHFNGKPKPWNFQGVPPNQFLLGVKTESVSPGHGGYSAAFHPVATGKRYQCFCH
jgi:hypothetical protein